MHTECRAFNGERRVGKDLPQRLMARPPLVDGLARVKPCGNPPPNKIQIPYDWPIA